MIRFLKLSGYSGSDQQVLFGVSPEPEAKAEAVGGVCGR